MSGGRDGFSKRKPKKNYGLKADDKSAADRGRAKPYGPPKRVPAARGQSRPQSSGDIKSARDLHQKAPATARRQTEVKDTKGDSDRRKPARAGDTKVTRKELRAVESFKKTQAYSGAVREAYDGLGDKGSRLAVARANYNLAVAGKRDLSPEDRSILATNVARRDRNRDLRSSAAQHDIVRTADLALAAAEREKQADKLQAKDPVRAYRLRRAGGAAGATDRAPLVNVGKTVGATAVAFKDEPVSVTKKTAKGAVEIVKAIPAGLVDTITDPIGSAKDAVKDYDRRYSGSFRARVKRIKKEGAAAELVDAVGLATLGGATAGRGLANTAKKGALGPKAKAVVSDPRPKLRESGGVTKKQKVSRNYFTAVAQRKHDALRAKKTAKALAAAKSGKGADAVAVQAARSGEVVRLRPEKVDRTQARTVAKSRSVAIHLLKAEQLRRVDQGAAKILARLNKHEREAFYYVAAGLAAPTRAKLETYLAERAASITAERAKDGVTPEGLLKRTDELRTIERLQANLDKIDLAKVAAARDDLHNESIRIGREDPSLNATQRLLRRYAQQAETLGLRRGEVEAPNPDPAGPPLHAYDGEESVSDFIKRVQTKADAEGLARPLYFPSERYDLDLQPDYASRAAGGSRGARSPFEYTGENFRLGLQDTSPDVFQLGLARNIKRKHNWTLVDRLTQQHALPGMRGTASTVRAQMAEQGVDPSSYVLWNPKVYRDELTAERRTSDPEALAAESAELRFAAPEEFGNARVQAAMRLARDASGPYHTHSGWVAVPKAAWKEIEDSAKPSGAIMRGFDVFKAKQSRILLGAGNIPWLQFQVVANGLMSGFATKGAVAVDLVKVNRWWKSLSDAERERADAYLGIGVVHDTAQPRLGATANNRIVNGWRVFKSLPFWDKQIAGRGPSTRQLNPIELMFRFDRAQTAAFKRAVLHNRVKREAFQRMGENMTAAQKLQNRIAHALTLGPTEQMAAIMRSEADIEHHAEKVNEWLGDYVTYTAAERKVLSRAIMFYGFMRYSLKFTLYTMPIKHPIQSAIIAKLGELQAEEIRELLGGDDLPWAFGKLYFGEKGKLREVDLAKANPALNTLMQSLTDKPSGWVNIAPPVLVSALEQAPGVGGRRFYFDRGWRVEGTSPEYGAKTEDYGLATRGRIAADQLLSLVYPYRVAEKLTQEGPQGDDSMLFSERPTVYKGKDNRSQAIRRALRRQAEFERENESLADELLPLTPQPTRDDAIMLERNVVDQLDTKKGKKPKKRARYFGASGGPRRPKYFGSGR